MGSFMVQQQHGHRSLWWCGRRGSAQLVQRLEFVVSAKEVSPCFFSKGGRVCCVCKGGEPIYCGELMQSCISNSSRSRRSDGVSGSAHWLVFNRGFTQQQCGCDGPCRERWGSSARGVALKHILYGSWSEGRERYQLLHACPSTVQG